jgi:hypothetical protein
MYRFLVASKRWKSRVLPQEIANSALISRSLSFIRTRWPETFNSGPSDQQPIFLLSAGWGSGSTLLQRLISSESHTMLWGEPFDHAFPVHRLCQMILPVDDRWPRESYFADETEKNLFHQQWIANLSPTVIQLRNAQRDFLESWLRIPAETHGRKTCGLKEVRLTADHARYLKWLFPKARIIFTYRDVLDSYRSCIGVPWLSVWPDRKVADPHTFAHHWSHLLTGFLELAPELDAMIVKYEDLIAGRTTAASIAEKLSIPDLDDSVLTKKIGSRSSRNKKLSAYERSTLLAITGELRASVGYS